MQDLIFTFNLVAPVFLLVAIGYFLRVIGIINDNFVSLSSKIVFSVALPALIFVEISKLDLNKIIDLNLILYAYAATIIAYILIWFISIPLTKDGKNRAVFIQGSFRSNFAIIGLALIANVFGNEILGKASIVLAFMIPLYNVFSVVALTVPVRKEKQLNVSGTLMEILKNPLIIAVIIALPFSYFRIHINQIFQTTINYLADLALPLALIGIGGFLNFKDIKVELKTTISAAILKLIIFPFAATFGAYLSGFRGNDLGILFILFACPTAIASFIMAEAMGVNSRLAGNILLITTLGSLITITSGLFILKYSGLI